MSDYNPGGESYNEIGFNLDSTAYNELVGVR
jgi:hypothetical protein